MPMDKLGALKEALEDSKKELIEGMRPELRQHAIEWVEFLEQCSPEDVRKAITLMEAIASIPFETRQRLPQADVDRMFARLLDLVVGEDEDDCD